MRLTILGALPNLNEIISEAKRHFGKYSEMKALYTDMVAYEAKRQKIPKSNRADYVITWYLPNKRKNKDNVMAGQKFIFDGLQRAGIITNDGWQQIGNVTHRFEVDKDNPRVEVDIVEVEEAAV